MTYEFGPFQLDPIQRRLARQDREIPLTAKVFDTLLVLVQHAGQTVTKHELLRQVWPDTAVEENNLTQAVSRLRKALDDGAGDQRYLLTIPGRGYRFVAPVRSKTSDAAAGGILDRGADPVPVDGREPGEPATVRLIVLPFRVLRPDSETDFLAFSLPDAITTSLSGLDSVTVRSSLTAARFAGDPPDLSAIAAQAGADVVLTGTILRDGEELRVNTQLVEAPGGAVIWSRVSQTPLGGIFRLQDELTQTIVESLAISLTARDRTLLRHAAPANTRAYDFYLRANQLSYDPARWHVARDLYLYSLAADPQYAPAWARLGRIYRVLAVYGETGREQHYRLAREAFARALELSPDLPLAHNLYTYVEVELGRAREAMVRLLDRARARPADAELFGGLVHACRYSDLLDAAVAAYRVARRIDPQIRTSVAYAYWALGQYEDAIRTDVDHPPFPTVSSLISLQRDEAAIAQLAEMESLALPDAMHYYIVAMRALLERRQPAAVEAGGRMLAAASVQDPCGRFWVGRLVARLGDTRQALALLRSAIHGGFVCYSVLVRDPWLESLRGCAGFTALVQDAERLRGEALTAFRRAGGDRILGRAAS